MTSLETRTGLHFDVRSATPADTDAVISFFARVSDEDRRFRFLSSVQNLSKAHAQVITDFTPQRRETFLAFLPGTDAIIAAATLAADSQGDSAEVAISIDADYKGRGIGWTLLDHAAAVAQQWGVRKLRSIESRENHAAIALEREQGFSVSAIEDDPTLLLLERQF
ncbi:GNAT family N-acetyltransferase [Sphingobium sp. AP49]|uniref:GNAT family N-acetyltransferase n=1 Tax=Sphingobium sp. AP49 TaxID=1144307 RepID=UPI00026ECCC5|nr:GNAT family N-acetyltransferase [Sphingobium sp. AP49]WHO38428.1 GNAT family N-acetyltransferase [Sphingobium sp. AP49]